MRMRIDIVGGMRRFLVTLILIMILGICKMTFSAVVAAGQSSEATTAVNVTITCVDFNNCESGNSTTDLNLDPGPDLRLDCKGSDCCDDEKGLTWNGYECVLFPGRACLDMDTKLARAYAHVDGQGQCVAHAYCSPSSGLCECESGYMASEGHQVCFLTHGSPCSDYWPCSKEAGLSCQDTHAHATQLRPQLTCQCSDWPNAEWDMDLKKCVMKSTPAHSSGHPSVIVANYHYPPPPVVLLPPPNPAPPHRLCPLNSFVVGDECKCYQGYAPTHRGGPCALTYGRTCNESVEELQCNSLEHLDCIDGACKCSRRKNFVYNYKERKCRRAAVKEEGGIIPPRVRARATLTSGQGQQCPQIDLITATAAAAVLAASLVYFSR